MPTLYTASGVAKATMSLAICAGVLLGFSSSISAAAPATCGAAIEVPEIERIPVDEVCHAEVMLEPGANTSTSGPQLEYDARTSADVVAPTVMADGSEAGEYEPALRLLLPAKCGNTNNDGQANLHLL